MTLHTILLALSWEMAPCHDRVNEVFVNIPTGHHYSMLIITKCNYSSSSSCTVNNLILIHNMDSQMNLGLVLLLALTKLIKRGHRQCMLSSVVVEVY